MSKFSKIVRRKITSEKFRSALKEQCQYWSERDDCYSRPDQLFREICSSIGISADGSVVPKGNLDKSTAISAEAFLRQESSTIGRRVSSSGRFAADCICKYLSGII